MHNNTVTQVSRGNLFYKGKANTIYETNIPNLLEMESTDRISARNGKKQGIIEGKGFVNNTISSILFTLFEKNGIPTHYVCEGSTPSSKIVKKAKMIKLEVIGRFIAAGSYCKRHPNVHLGTVFPDMVFELTYKDDALGDPFITEAEAISKKYNAATLDQIEDIEDYTYHIGSYAQDFFKKLGLTLVDFKVEFGIDEKTGKLILCDEFSPDTCRLWDENGKSYDKDVFRKNMGDVSKTYKRLLNLMQN